MSEHPAVTPAEPNPLLKFLLDIGPLLVFILVNWRLDFYWGTAAFMICTVISLAIWRVVFGRFPLMPLVAAAFVVVFGGLMLFLQDDRFIKIKPTIVNVLFAVILFAGLLFGHSLLKFLFGTALRLSEPGWRILTIRWAFFFLFLALVNEFVWRSFSNEFWLNFKLFGIIPLIMIFAIAQAGTIRRYEEKDTARAAE